MKLVESCELFLSSLLFFHFFLGLLRLQSIYQDLSFTNDSFHIDMVKQISSAEEAIDIIKKLEKQNR